jgi:hypothetical protein
MVEVVDDNSGPAVHSPVNPDVVVEHVLGTQEVHRDRPVIKGSCKCLQKDGHTDAAHSSLKQAHQDERFLILFLFEIDGMLNVLEETFIFFFFIYVILFKLEQKERCLLALCFNHVHRAVRLAGAGVTADGGVLWSLLYFPADLS